MIVLQSQTVKSVGIHNICINKDINFLIKLITAIDVISFFDGVVKKSTSCTGIFSSFSISKFSKLKRAKNCLRFSIFFFSAAQN